MATITEILEEVRLQTSRLGTRALLKNCVLGPGDGDLTLAEVLYALAVRTVEEAPSGFLLDRDGRLIIPALPRLHLGAWRQGTCAGNVNGTQVHLSEIQVE